MKEAWRSFKIETEALDRLRPSHVRNRLDRERKRFPGPCLKLDRLAIASARRAILGEVDDQRELQNQSFFATSTATKEESEST